MRLAALAVLLLPACSEYELNPGGYESEGESDTGMTGDTGDGPHSFNVCDDTDEPAAGTVALNTECDVEYSEGSFTPVVEWTYGSSSFYGPPAVGQIHDSDGSGSIDSSDMPVVVMYQNSRVVAVAGDGSGPIWQTSAASYGQDGGLAIGDIDNDGQPDVITASNNKVCALWGETGGELWCATGLSGLDSYGYNYPSVADMDGDGRPEVTVGNYILDGETGSVVGRGSYGIGAAPYGGTPSGGTYGALSVPVDMNGDGELELVTGNAAYAIDGTAVWYNGGLDGIPAVADFDGDGEPEIVKTSGIYVTGMESDGTEVWGPITYSGNLGAPAADDLDGDGVPEVVFAAQNNLIAMVWGGSEMWRASISDQSGAAGPTLFDFEMDGYPEVLYADEQSIQFFSGLDGSPKYNSNAHSSYTILETPIVADVDGDDQVEIILGHGTASGAIGALTVYGDLDETWPPGRKIWNQHAYSITNIGDLGEVPAPQVPNWQDYNSFRSGDVGRPPGEYWDLRAEVIDVCDDECDTGNVIVAARIANAGNVTMEAGVSISLRAGAGGPILADAVTTRPVPSGETGEMVVFEVPGGLIAGTTPVVTADEDAAGLEAYFECDESNNADNWSSTVCD